MVVLAQALVSRPKVMLVDELSLGLAPGRRQAPDPDDRSVAATGAGVLLIEQFAHVALGLANTPTSSKAAASATRHGRRAQEPPRAPANRLPPARLGRPRRREAG